MSERQREAEVNTKIRAVSVQKIDEKATHNTPVVFNFGVNMEEAERKNDSVMLGFHMTMGTEPSIVKFVIEGTASVLGDSAQIEQALAADPQTNVPEVFTRIYQEVYSVVFMLAGTIDVPYPSPALLKKPHVQVAYPTQA